MLLSISACLLLLSFISAARALAIRGSEILHLGAVVEDENGYFRKYNKAFHAQGLLYCATMNTATNDHIAQFVKGAHVLMAFAVITFASGAVATGLRLNVRSAPPVRAEVVGTISLSPADLSELRSGIREIAGASTAQAPTTGTENQLELIADRVTALETDLSGLRGDIREVLGASAAREAATDAENQLKLLGDRLAALEAEVRTLRNSVPIARHAKLTHSKPLSPTLKP